jgi:hypothetical protein
MPLQPTLRAEDVATGSVTSAEEEITRAPSMKADSMPKEGVGAYVTATWRQRASHAGRERNGTPLRIRLLEVSAM